MQSADKSTHLVGSTWLEESVEDGESVSFVFFTRSAPSQGLRRSELVVTVPDSSSLAEQNENQVCLNNEKESRDSNQ